MKFCKIFLSFLLVFLLAFSSNVISFADDVDEKKLQALENIGGYIPHKVNIGEDISLKDTYGLVKAPASYDMRKLGYLPAVRVQGSTGLCWAFATTASAESNLIMKKEASKTIDLSELQLAYFTYNRVNDPSGGLRGDSVSLANGENYIMVGGNMFYASETLSKWIGLVDESLAPFDPNKNVSEYISWTPSDSLSYEKNSYHLRDSYCVSLNDIQTLKNMIIKYGAAAASYAHQTNYMNYTTNAYYCNVNTGDNHAVSIVGWDDNYNRNNFKSDCMPKSNGAWIARNSWGSDWGDGGYFYISYEDASLGDNGDDGGYAYLFDMEQVTDGEKMYQYDGGIQDIKLMAENSIYTASIFTAQNEEILTSVGVPVADANTNYRFIIYTDVGASPISGKANGTWQSGTFDHSGFELVDLANPVLLQKGQKYSVVMYLERKGKSLNIPVDHDSIGYGVECDVTNYKGQSFVSSDAKSWDDLYLTNDAVVRMRAVTVPLTRKYVRISGQTRYKTAEQIAAYGWEKAENVILASGLDYADALCSVPLAAQLDAPILLTGGKTIEDEVKNSLKSLKAKKVIIVGGQGRISDGYKNGLISMGYSVSRISGKDRYETCIRIAEELAKSGKSPEKFAVVTGLGYADALSISPYAATVNMPIIYTHPTLGMPEICKNYIAKNCAKDDEIFVIAGNKTISDETKNMLAQYCKNVERIAGLDRFDTSLAIVKRFSDSFSNDLMVATGNDFPDALSGGVLAAKLDVPILLANSANAQHLKKDAVDYVQSINPNVIYLLGGAGVLPDRIKAFLI